MSGWPWKLQSDRPRWGNTACGLCRLPNRHGSTANATSWRRNDRPGRRECRTLPPRRLPAHHAPRRRESRTPVNSPRFDAPALRPLRSEDAALLDSFRQRYPFALDPFQEQAILRVLSGESVLVSAPTGAGKTLIAEFAIYRALAARRRVIYTTPLKALSNQKYGDFTRQYGSDLVGILTGDVKVNPGAPILVMTTEILRNLLF